MQKKRTHKPLGLPSISLAGTMLKQLFLVGFAFAFFLQQFHPNFFSTNALSFQKISSGLHIAKQVQGVAVTPLLAQEPVHNAMEMEADEDDDRQNSEPELYSTGNPKYPTDQLACNYVYNIRYLQLASSVRQQPLIPYFILHHSWKNHIA
jgi:hypothetical protein